jgi:lipopolysaccharide transport protein LptA
MLCAVSLAAVCVAESKAVHESSLGGALSSADFGKLPTVITSKSLEVNAEKRIFMYRTNVVAKQGDMMLTCDELEGYYSENNQIEKIIAKKRVTVVKGPAMKASAQRAVYDTATGIITMTENPKLEQNGSILEADVVKVFVKENRSTAEGDVSVTVVNQGAATLPGVTAQPTPTATPIPGVRRLGQ